MARGTDPCASFGAKAPPVKYATALLSASVALCHPAAYAQNSDWVADYELDHPLYRAESFREVGDAYVVQARGGNERSELTIDVATGDLRSVASLSRGCGTLVYGPIPLGPREVVRIDADAAAGQLRVRRTVLTTACAIDFDRWDRTYALPPGTRFQFDAGDVSADSARLSVVGVIEVDGRRPGAPYLPVVLSLDAGDGALRYAFVGDTVRSTTVTGQLGAAHSLSDGSTAAVLFGDAGRAQRLYWVDARGELRFTPVTPADSAARFARVSELSDGSLAAWTVDASSRRVPGLERYTSDGRRAFAIAYDDILAAELGADTRALSHRAGVNRAGGDFAVALYASRDGAAGLALVQTRLDGSVVGTKYLDVPLKNDLLTVANRLYEDASGALVFFGEAGAGMGAARVVGAFVSDVPTVGTSENKLELYPTITTGTVTVDWSATGLARGAVTVADALGRAVWRGVLPKGGRLELGGWPAGRYVVGVVGVGSGVVVVE